MPKTCRCPCLHDSRHRQRRRNRFLFGPCGRCINRGIQPGAVQFAEPTRASSLCLPRYRRPNSRRLHSYYDEWVHFPYCGKYGNLQTQPPSTTAHRDIFLGLLHFRISPAGIKAAQRRSCARRALGRRPVSHVFYTRGPASLREAGVGFDKQQGRRSTQTGGLTSVMITVTRLPGVQALGTAAVSF